MIKKNIAIIAVTLLTMVNYSFAAADLSASVKEAKAIIAAGLRSTDERVRANAVEAVSATGTPELTDDAEALLDDPSVIVRFASAIAMGDMNYSHSKLKLKELLRDRNLNVVLASSYALSKMGEIQYSKAIDSNAMNTNQDIRANVAMLLGKLGKKESLPLLYKIKDDPDSSNAAAFNATEAIAKIGDEKIYKKIWAMLISVYADDRYMGVQAMASFGGTRGANAIISLLDDEIPQVRLSAAGQLGVLKDPSGAIVVKEYLTGPLPEKKEDADRCNVIAALAIGQIGSDDLKVFLPKMLKNENPYVQLAAAKSILTLKPQ
jgi:HEAT repeat protein